jgi:hypothetical protein
MKTKIWKLLFVGGTSLVSISVSQIATAYPALWLNFRQTRLPYNYCIQDADRTVRSLGLQNLVIDSFGRGGTTNTVRAYILCVRRQGNGPCPRTDGATVVFTSAGDNDNDAKALLAQMDQRFGNGVLIDCN